MSNELPITPPKEVSTKEKREVTRNLSLYPLRVCSTLASGGAPQNMEDLLPR